MRRPSSLKAKASYFHDLVAAGASFAIALYLRVGPDIAQYWSILTWGVPAFALTAAPVFRFMGLHRGVWRYASVGELVAIAKASVLSVLIFLPLLFMVTRLEGFPRSQPLINVMVLMVLLGAPRFLYRQFKERRSSARAAARQRAIPVLLVGCGDQAELFIRATRGNAAAEYQAVGMVSDKPGRTGRDIHGLAVMGGIQEIPAVVKRLAERGQRPQRLVIASETIGPQAVSELIEIAESQGMVLARLPRVTDFRGLGQEAVAIQSIAIEDLLGRAQAVLDRTPVVELVRGRRVLVTGAGGSIGSELVRQVAALEPARLVLLDSSEYALYQIDLELGEKHPALPRAAVIGDIRDRQRLGDVMAREKPELVFHAGALKHVPLVEANPDEGVLTNAIGSRNVADCCREHGVGTMVLISTDKAVNPTNVMGAAKRIAESYCQALDLAGGPTRFVTVRFGNVLGSTGSVVPLFKRQLAAGGPLTVTHPEMVRYFMTIREAVELVLSASAFASAADAEPGKICVLDMGEPVRIVDLATQMIRLAGLRPNVDVQIEFTGLRPGEKLYEEVFHASEPLLPTRCPGVLQASSRVTELATLCDELDGLERACRAHQRDEVLTTVRRLVPEYSPSGAADKLPA